MNDSDEIRDYLDRMAASDPYGAVAGGPLLERGRRGRRRRRVLTTGGTVAVVAAVIAVTATLPSGGSARPPGTDASVAAPVATEKSGSGDPTRADPNADDATVLRACAAKLAANLAGFTHLPADIRRQRIEDAKKMTSWRLVTRSKLPPYGTMFIALSPRGDLATHCEVYPEGSRMDTSVRSPYLKPDPMKLAEGDPPRTLYPGTLKYGWPCEIVGCTGFLVMDTGRVPANIVRLRVKATYGGSVDVPVRNSYYALMWATGDPKRRPDLTVTAYDANGKVVRPG